MRNSTRLLLGLSVCAILGLTFAVIGFGFANGDVKRPRAEGVDPRTQQTVELNRGPLVRITYDVDRWNIHPLTTKPPQTVYARSWRLAEDERVSFRVESRTGRVEGSEYAAQLESSKRIASEPATRIRTRKEWNDGREWLVIEEFNHHSRPKRHQIYYVTPTRQGHVVMRIIADHDDLPRHAEWIEELKAGVHIAAEREADDGEDEDEKEDEDEDQLGD